jgi:hypothetical protein
MKGKFFWYWKPTHGGLGRGLGRKNSPHLFVVAKHDSLHFTPSKNPQHFYEGVLATSASA